MWAPIAVFSVRQSLARDDVTMLKDNETEGKQNRTNPTKDPQLKPVATPLLIIRSETGRCSQDQGAVQAIAAQGGSYGGGKRRAHRPVRTQQ